MKKTSPKGSHGGKRQGAGKPPGKLWQSTIDKALHREELRKLVVAELEPMTKAQIAAAKGIQHFVLRDKSGKFQKVTSAEAAVAAMNDPEAVYDFWARDPNIQAFADLMNRALDKPTEHVQVEEVKKTQEMTDDELKRLAKELAERA